LGVILPEERDPARSVRDEVKIIYSNRLAFP
jgi:hypothetical protein